MWKGLPVLSMFLLFSTVVGAVGMVSPALPNKWTYQQTLEQVFLIRGDNTNQTVEFFMDGGGGFEAEGKAVYRRNISLSGYELRRLELDVRAVEKGAYTVRWGFRYLPGPSGLALSQEVVDTKRITVCEGSDCTKDEEKEEDDPVRRSGGGGGGGVVYYPPNVTKNQSNQSVPTTSMTPITPVMQDVAVGEGALALGVVDTSGEVQSATGEVVETVSAAVASGDAAKSALQVVLVLGAVALIVEGIVMAIVRDEL